MQDGQLLNHFAQFDSLNTYQPEASPVLPTGGRVAAQAVGQQLPEAQMQTANQQFAQFSNYINSTITSQNDRINNLSLNLDRLINTLQSQYQQQPVAQQSQEFSEWSVATKAKAQQQKTEVKNSFSSPYSIKDGGDVVNAWNLASRIKTSSSDNIKGEVIGIAKKMGLASSLPKAALDWAETHGISLSDDQPQLKMFSTSAAISDTDKAFLEAASAVVDRLSDSEDLFSFYGIIKNTMKHLDAPTYEQVMSDFCSSQEESAVNQQPSSEPAKEEVASPTNLASAFGDFGTIDEFITDEEIEQLIAEDAAAETAMPVFSEVDSKLWAMAQSVAKRRSPNSDNITDAQVSSIYEVLAEAKRHKAKAMACADKPTQSNPSKQPKLKDKELYSNAKAIAKHKYSDEWPSHAASDYLVSLYKSMHQHKYGSLENAFADDCNLSNLSEDLLPELND